MKAIENSYQVTGFSSHLLILVALVVFSFSCSQGDVKVPSSWEVTFFSLGARIHFRSPDRAEVQRVQVFEEAGTGEVPVVRMDLNGYPRLTETVYFRWKKGTAYRFEVAYEGNELTSRTVRSSQSDLQGSIEISIPYATNDAKRMKSEDSTHDRSVESLVLRGSNIIMTVLIRNELEAPLTYDVQLRIPSEIEVEQMPSVWQIRTDCSPDPLSIFDEEQLTFSAKGEVGEEIPVTTLTSAGRFTIESDLRYSQLALSIPDEGLSVLGPIHAGIRFENSSGAVWNRYTTVSLRSATMREIALQLSIEDVLMPTNASGVFDSRQRVDAISYPRPLFGRFGKWLGMEASPMNHFQPISHQSVRLRNKSEDAIHVVVSAINRDLRSGEALPFLAPPEAINGGSNRSLSFVSLSGKSTTDVSLPIYFNPSEAEKSQSADFLGTGQYEREIEVKVWGSDVTVLRVKRPLRIVTPNFHAFLVTICAFAVMILGIFLFARFHQLIFSRFSTKQLILIALFGTTIFVAVSVPATLFSNLISALLGPIAFLVTGLMSEMLYYCLLTSLLTLLPKPGVIALVSSVRLLLGGVTLGLFNPMVLVYTVVSVLLLEIGFQITRNGRNVLLLALAFGVCDVLAVYVEFQLSMALYRLFYAEWFILTRLVVDGFTYTFIGVFLGRRLGKGLWRVAE